MTNQKTYNKYVTLNHLNLIIFTDKKIPNKIYIFAFYSFRLFVVFIMQTKKLNNISNVIIDAIKNRLNHFVLKKKKKLPIKIHSKWNETKKKKLVNLKRKKKCIPIYVDYLDSPLQTRENQVYLDRHLILYYFLLHLILDIAKLNWVKHIIQTTNLKSLRLYRQLKCC